VFWRLQVMAAAAAAAAAAVVAALGGGVWSEGRVGVI
jgi:hypothetical protein